MKDFSQLKPREVEAYFKQLILSVFGNKTEDGADIYASHGSYHVSFDVDGSHFSFDFKKKTAPKIVKVIRALGKG